ncbi:hypothetical protein DFP72DRAFT_449722 [Ephemerocybe angulata]|uniref:MYND-type domain-containing protein n=1 Tax=Ephemerocybe angulata TaxID=980116 RepID=A0A8H6M326_9AGAR|nr:hypothetical protein DFP72DRAFT_449722 [Tulosesus angulatus]
MSSALVERNATQFLTSMFPATWEIAVHIFNTKTPFRSVKNARDVISGNFLAHTIRLLASSHLTPDETSQGKEIIKLLGRYASCPDVIVELGKLPEIDRFSLRGLAGNEQAWFFWNGFRLSIMQRNTYFIKTQYNGDFICDYASCHSTNHGTAGSSDTGKLKKCSRCSSVVYCSTECQRKDWIEFHRGECTESRNEHIRRKSSQSCYTHQMRRFHVAYVAFLLNRYCSGLEWDIADRRSITSLDGSCLILQPDSVSLEGEGWWESHPQLHFPQHYLKPRLSALKDEYISGAGSPGVRLVQAFFPLGMKFGVVLTVRLTKSGDQYKGGYSMVRYGLPA